MIKYWYYEPFCPMSEERAVVETNGTYYAVAIGNDYDGITEECTFDTFDEVEKFMEARFFEVSYCGEVLEDDCF